MPPATDGFAPGGNFVKRKAAGLRADRPDKTQTRAIGGLGSRS